MNKVIELFKVPSPNLPVTVWAGQQFGILETPCFPCSWYCGPVNFAKAPTDRIGEWFTGDNATSNFYPSIALAQEAKKKILSR